MPTIKTASGNQIAIADSASAPLQGLRVYGKTTQNGTPTPDAPVPLVSVGDDGAVDVTVAGKNLYSGGDLSFTNMVRVNLEAPLPPGTYNIGALVESEATDTDTSRVIFLNADGADRGPANLTRGTRSVVRKVVTEPIYTLSFWAGSNRATSAGNACTWKNIMISRDGAPTDYEPYKGQTLTLATPNGLPGIPVPSGGNYTDADGQQWACDEIDLERGKYVQRVKKLTVGTVKEVYENGGVWYAVVRPDAKGKPYHAVSSTHFIGTTGKLNAGNVAVTSTGNIQTALTDQSIQTVDTWNAWLAAQTSPVEIIYILATPIETDLAINEVLAYKALKTNHPNTTIMSNEDAWLYAAYIQQQAGFTTYWTDPKTDWKNGDHFNLDPDYERIKNNITHVQELTNKVNARVEIDAMGDYAITEYPLAAFLNTIATNIEKLSKSMFLVTPTAEMPMHVGNGPGWTAEELNDIEGNLLNMYEELNRQYALVPRLDIMMGIGGINFGS